MEDGTKGKENYTEISRNKSKYRIKNNNKNETKYISLDVYMKKKLAFWETRWDGW